MRYLKRIRKKCIISLLMYFFIFAGLIMSIIGISKSVYRYPINDGNLNLANKTLGNKVIELNGDWKLYKYINDEKKERVGCLSVPNTWSEKIINNVYCNKYNVMIYEINIKVDKPGDYCLKLSYISSAYQLYVNDKLICSSGVVADSKELEKAIWNSRFIYFNTNKTDINIALKVSNYHCENGGIVLPVYFGKQIPMYRYQTVSLIKHIIYLGIFLGMAFFLIVFNWSMDKKYQAWYLAIFCIASIITAAIIDGESFVIIFNNINIEVVKRIEFFAIMAQITGGMSFLDCSYPILGRKHGMDIIKKVDLIFAVMIFILPNINIVFNNYFLNIMIFINCVLYLRVIIGALRKRKENSVIFLIGFSIYVICSILQIYYVINYKIKYNFEVYYVGVFFFLLCQSYVLVFDVQANCKNSKFAHEMEIAFLQAQISPHFLFNVLNNVICLWENDIQTAKKLLLCLCEFLKTKYRFDYRYNIYTKLKDELDLIKAYIELENIRFNNAIILQDNISEDLLHMKILPMLLQPIVENSIKHGYKSEPMRIVLDAKKVDNKIFISVCDNGHGMSMEVQKNLFNNVTKKSVGLKNVNYRTNKCYGTNVKVESKLNHGTKIIVIIPLD